MKKESHLKPPGLIRLNQLPTGNCAQIVRIEGGRQLTRRLLSLGLRVGTELHVLQRRGRSVVVASSGNRVAIGGTIADKLLIK